MSYLRGITKLNLSPYAPKSYLCLIIGATKNDMIKHFTTNNSEFFNLPSNNLYRLRIIFDAMKVLKNRFGDFSQYETFYTETIKHGDFYDLYKSCGFYLVIMPQIDKSRLNDVHYVSDIQSTISHEVLHLCQSFLPLFLDRNDEAEAEAYFHQSLTEKLINQILAQEIDYEF